MKTIQQKPGTHYTSLKGSKLVFNKKRDGWMATYQGKTYGPWPTLAKAKSICNYLQD
jgi:hypothetical protein